MTFLYNEPKENRIQEYIYCLEKNSTHRSIDRVIITYDPSKDTDSNPLLDYLLQKEQEGCIELRYKEGRPTFGYFFELTNNEFLNRKIIIASADIYFNNTLCLLDDLDFTNTFLALTRWDVTKEGKLQQFLDNRGKPRTLSQDVWIFQSPIRKFKNDTITLGVLRCDPKIAYQAHTAGYQVCNPCLDVQCCHYHLSNVRNYNHKFPPRGNDLKATPWQTLAQMKQTGE